jgi:hypothetical protein
MEFNNPNQDKDSHSSFCFATLALGAPYWAAAIRLASDLETHAPGKSLVVLTDNPIAFRNQYNIIPHFHRQKELFNCWNDKSFYVIRRDNGREATFLHIWGNVAEQFDLAGIVSTDAICMGIASAVTGWKVAEGESGEIAPFYLARTHLSEGGERENRKRPIWRRALKRISNKFLVTRKRLEYIARGP